MRGEGVEGLGVEDCGWLLCLSCFILLCSAGCGLLCAVRGEEAFCTVKKMGKRGGGTVEVVCMCMCIEWVTYGAWGPLLSESGGLNVCLLVAACSGRDYEHEHEHGHS